MTCEQLRKQAEETTRLEDAEFWRDSAVSAHVAICSECGQLVRERQNVRKSLQLARESVGSVPESLDAAVLAAYRRLVAEGQQTPRRSARHPNFSLILRWSLAAALGLMVTATVLFVHHRPGPTIATPLRVQPSSRNGTVPRRVSADPQIRAARRAPIRKRSVSSATRPTVGAMAPIPDEFRGLMYCDELSCNGAMDMIRVQLPSSMIARPSSPFPGTSGPVNADVLIGPDGIARGIRIEEREF